ncbi:TPA: hypothetical protein O7V39_003432 [Salmonella enterica]|nr:hypothetical protein [Salmonella enterica]HDC1601909.1 hypothetical protein [Salmonella enterica]
MTTITKERIELFVKSPLENGLTRGEQMDLARIALASMDAKPVFFIEVEGDDWIQAGRIPGSTFDFNNLPDGINTLYAAPPAPVVPDEIEPGSNNTYDYVDGWNACRAAMLKGDAK